MKNIHVKRVYEPVDPKDGARVLVDRVWPRGMTKERLHAHWWLKEVAPSTALRKWFNHDPDKWHEFKRRYGTELRTKQNFVGKLLDMANKKTLTLLYSAKDTECNQAVALAEYLLFQMKKPGS